MTEREFVLRYAISQKNSDRMDIDKCKEFYKLICDSTKDDSHTIQKILTSAPPPPTPPKPRKIKVI